MHLAIVGALRDSDCHRLFPPALRYASIVHRVLNEWNVLLHIDTASVTSLEITHTHNGFFFIALFICRRVFPIEISLQLPIDISDQSTLHSQYTISNVYTQTRTLDNTSKFFFCLLSLSYQNHSTIPMRDIMILKNMQNIAFRHHGSEMFFFLFYAFSAVEFDGEKRQK